MSLKKSFLLTGILFLLTGGLYSYAASHRFEVQLEQAQIQQILAPHFPIHKEWLFGMAKMKIDLADITVPADSERLNASFGGEINARGKSYPGSATISFGLEYDSQNAKLLLTHPQVENISFAGLPESVSPSVINSLLPLVQERISQVALYQIQADASMQQLLLHKTLKNLQIHDGKVILAFGL